MADQPLERILSTSEVLALLPFRSRTTLWKMQREGDFPPPVQVTRSRIGWRESDIRKFLESRQPRVSADAA